MRSGEGQFPSTHWSLVVGARDPSEPDFRKSLETLMAMYWRPVYVYIRGVWGCSNEDAKDFTQEFLIRIIEAGAIEKYDREKGRFRTFLKAALRNFLMDQTRTARCQKRGGDRVRIPLDGDAPAMPSGGGTPVELFDRAWGQALLDQAIEEVRERLSAEGREICWKAFDSYELQPGGSSEISYREVAEKLGISEREVKSHLAYVRMRIREAIRRGATETVVTEADLYQELKDLFS